MIEFVGRQASQTGAQDCIGRILTPSPGLDFLEHSFADALVLVFMMGNYIFKDHHLPARAAEIPKDHGQQGTADSGALHVLGDHQVGVFIAVGLLDSAD